MKIKINNKRWYPFVFLFGSIVAICLWYKLVPEHKPEFLLSLIGGVGGFTYFFYRQHLDETKLFKELFIDFNARYANLNTHLNNIHFGSKKGLLSVEEREYLFSYFNLCAEEYFFYKAGYINQDIWEAWQSGMRVFFNDERIRALWEQDCTSGSYYNFTPPM